MQNPKPTYWSRIFKKLLEKRLDKKGVHVVEERCDGHKHVDLSVPSAFLDIEIDGSQHLSNAKQITRDFKRSNYSREAGFETLHIHNIDLEHNANKIASAVARVAEEREEGIDSMAGIQKEEVYEGLTYPLEETKK